MAALLPPQRHEEKEPVSLPEKKRKKRKRTKHDPELERLDSLPWNSSLPNEEEDDAFSLFIGSGDLDGGFLSLEEINESEYGLDGPGVKKKISNKKKKKQKLEDFTEGSGEDVEADPAEGMAEEKNAKAKKKKKKSKKNKTKAVQQEDEPATVIDNKDNEEEEMPNEDETYPEFYEWNELRLHPLLMKSISRIGFKEPTPIQRACIPAAAHQGKDVIGAAETGSGKTLAFGLPIFQRLLEEREKAANMLEEKGEEAAKYAPKGVLRALIITPTRELALQVTDHLKEFGKDINVRVVPIVGGMSAEKQERLLKTRPEIIVGTPGRLWELISGGEKHLVELHSLSFFVLDEADRMVEAGHFCELQSIIEMLPMTKGATEGQSQNTQNCVTVSSLSRKKRQTFVFSATLSLSADFRRKLKRGSLKSKQSTEGLNSIEILSERAGMKPNAAIVDLTNASILAKNLEESFIECREEDKDAYLYYILSIHGERRTIVFCTSIAALRHISSILRILGINVSTLHAQMQQRARLKAIDRFRANEHGILVATDVAARGLDIPGVRTVVHYQLPHSAEVYVHRSGRTARASSDGCSIALISPNDSAKFASLCKSFSKESIKRFPLESSYMPEVMKRLSVARQIDKISRKDSQERANKSWLERSAESLELVVENYDSEEERVKNFKQKKACSVHLKKLQQELGGLISRPLRPKTFSHRYPTAAGVTHLIQHQFEELAKQKGDDNLVPGENKRRKMVVIGQDCVEPLQALRSAGREVLMDGKDMSQKRRNVENLRRKRKEEKKRLRDQRRKQKKQFQGRQ
ncbi:DEAD-box ATP-dependent RNA helicase 13 [Hibiscus syriacus]|uniref:ATP-dependent RNA helicase n=1 Tax=Hibiscus syriacus TaxID=106335 RepID=A0A6A3C3T9_HIBSY|nr:DEAD-box ATP-dependent RNA helicase 13-like [Hibiscus syriacus]KAE8721759.1 DEAD-box ATP-dependent RNA helicase 13 [Hibiscus syriacus]